jgi:hypothetical protein
MTTNGPMNAYIFDQVVDGILLPSLRSGDILVIDNPLRRLVCPSASIACSPLPASKVLQVPAFLRTMICLAS